MNKNKIIFFFFTFAKSWVGGFAKLKIKKYWSNNNNNKQTNRTSSFDFYVLLCFFFWFFLGGGGVVFVMSKPIVFGMINVAKLETRVKRTALPL